MTPQKTQTAHVCLRSQACTPIRFSPFQGTQSASTQVTEIQVLKTISERLNAACSIYLMHHRMRNLSLSGRPWHGASMSSCRFFLLGFKTTTPHFAKHYGMSTCHTLTRPLPPSVPLASSRSSKNPHGNTTGASEPHISRACPWPEIRTSIQVLIPASGWVFASSTAAFNLLAVRHRHSDTMIHSLFGIKERHDQQMYSHSNHYLEIPSNRHLSGQRQLVVVCKFNFKLFSFQSFF